MSLRRAVAVPFRVRGREQLSESDLLVALSLDREWFTPDQAKRLVDVAEAEGLLAREAGDVVAQFDPDTVDVPDDFVPDETVLQQRDTFQRALDALVDAGRDKRESVAAINGLQSDLGVTAETAAVVYARRQGLAVDGLIDRALEDL